VSPVKYQDIPFIAEIIRQDDYVIIDHIELHLWKGIAVIKDFAINPCHTILL
jgi:hypothetical protein